MRAVIAVELILSLVFGLMFIGRYLFVEHWWRTRLGWLVLLNSIAWTAFISALTIEFSSPHPAFNLPTWAVLLGFVDASMFGQALTLFWFQFEERRNNREGESGVRSDH